VTEQFRRQNCPLQADDRIKRAATLVPIAFALLVWVCAFFAGVSSGVATSFSHLYPNLIGAAAAISSQVDGLKGHPYEAYKSVRMALEKAGVSATEENFPQNYRNYPLLSSALKSAESVDVCGSPLVSVPFNDQGAIEYTHAAFRLFGIDVKSLYYFYFVILGISAATYLVSFWRDFVACVVLFGAACALYLFMPRYFSQVDQVLTVSNPRFLSTLGIIPLLHIAFLIVRGETALRWSSIATIAVQAAILSFVFAVRSSSSWMVLSVLLLVAFYVATAVAPTFRWNAVYSAMKRRGAAALMMVAVMLAFASVRVLLEPPTCGQGPNAHIIWNDIFLPFAFSPDWQERFGARYDHAVSDQLSYTAAKLYVEEHHLPYPTEPNIFQKDNRTGDFVPLGSWTTYERVMRSVVFEFVRDHPLFALKSFLIYRPLGFVRAMAITAGIFRTSVPAAAFVIFIAMCCCIGICASGAPSEKDDSLGFGSALCILALCFLISLDSAIIVFSDPHLIPDQAYVAVTAIVLSLVGAIAAGFAYFKRAVGGNAAPENT
jgi:hypothetical protein